MPRLQRRGISVQGLVKGIYPLSLMSMGAMLMAGAGYSVLTLICFCLSSSVIAMVQPTVGLSFEARLAGKALCAYNLVIFLGIFVVQWGLGLMIDAFAAAGLAIENSYRGAFLVDMCCCGGAYLYFLFAKGDNSKEF